MVSLGIRTGRPALRRVVRSVAWLCALAILLAAGSAVLWAARATFALFIALGVDMNCDDRRLHAGH